MKILLIEDHALFREGLLHLLKALDAAVEIVEAPDARTALGILRQQDDLDLILLDLSLPDAKPFDVMQACRRLQPQVPVVVLSATQERFEVERVMSLGAQAYLFKSATSQSILSALRRVVAGEVVVPRLDDLGEPLDGERAAGSKGLTQRQVQVLGLLSRGLANKEIGDALGMAENTVKVHLAQIYRQLGVTSRTAALLRAMEIGLLGHERR